MSEEEPPRLRGRGDGPIWRDALVGVLAIALLIGLGVWLVVWAGTCIAGATGGGR